MDRDCSREVRISLLGALLGIRLVKNVPVDANKRARGVAWNSIGRLVVYCLLTRDNIIDNY